MDQAESKESTSGLSGKLLIIGILIAAFLAAGTSWWFRYEATHGAATFWGPSATMIRDARAVELWKPVNFHPELRDATLSTDDSEWHDVSAAHGLVHLRNALLEDHSFKWPPTKISSDLDWKQWAHGLRFRDGSTNAVVLFSQDFKFVRLANGDEMLSCEPIAKGLREMFGEFSGAATIAPPGPAEQGPAAPIGPALPAR